MKTKELKNILNLFRNVIHIVAIRPITDLVEIYIKDNIVHLCSTDNITHIIATIEDDNNTNMDNVVVSLSSLLRLVKLTTSEDIYMSKQKDKNYINMIGNGNYKIPLQLDEMGNEILLPIEMPQINENLDKYSTYKKQTFQDIHDRNKLALYTGTDHEEFNKYYMNDNDDVISTDSFTIAYTYSHHIMAKELSPYVIEQLTELPFDELNIYTFGNNYRISADNIQMYIKTYETKEFPYNLLTPFLNAPNNSELFPDFIFINKENIKSIIKRQHCFKTSFDVPSILFNIHDNRIFIENKPHDFIEELRESDGEPVEGFFKSLDKDISIYVNTEKFLSAIKNMGAELKLLIGEKAICLADGVGFYVISVME